MHAFCPDNFADQRIFSDLIREASGDFSILVIETGYDDRDDEQDLRDAEREVFVHVPTLEDFR